MHSAAPSNWTFRPAISVSLAALLVIMLTLALGQWQQRRAGEKLALAHSWDERSGGPALSMPSARVDPSQGEYRRFLVQGEYAPALGVFLDNKVHGGVVGYHLITPLRISGGDRYVLINRGWIAAGLRRDVLPVINTPPGTQSIEGIAVVPSQRFLELAPDDLPGKVRQNLVIGKMESELRIALQPVVIQQTGGPDDGLVRTWERPDIGVDRHRAYSLQWYLLSALTAVLYVFLNLKRSRRTPQ